MRRIADDMAVGTAPLVGVAFYNNNCNPWIPL
nr:MAG TPA: hypothetical protein [Caudoviricetes sp.]